MSPEVGDAQGAAQTVREQELHSYFSRVPVLTLRDPLAAILGATTSDEGLLTYHYVDAIRLAGHSCPTVAGAWLMTLHGLHALYGEEVPLRGGVEVHMSGASDEGVNGVIASVVQLLTGAAAETGFHGLGGRFVRRDLLHWNHPGVRGAFALRRVDTGQGVQMNYNPQGVGFEPMGELRQLMPKVVGGFGTVEENRRFGEIWQDRVRRILVDHCNDPSVIQISEWSSV